jgi:hypothetical protein
MGSSVEARGDQWAMMIWTLTPMSKGEKKRDGERYTSRSGSCQTREPKGQIIKDDASRWSKRGHG